MESFVAMIVGNPVSPRTGGKGRLSPFLLPQQPLPCWNSAWLVAVDEASAHMTARAVDCRSEVREIVSMVAQLPEHPGEHVTAPGLLEQPVISE